MSVRTLEAEEFVGCRLDDANQCLEVPDIAPLYPVDYQHFNIVITLIYAIGEDLLQYHNL